MNAPFQMLPREVATDEDLELVTLYLGGFMTEAQEADFDERLATDEPFFMRVSPYIKAWYSKESIPAAELAASRISAERLGDDVTIHPLAEHMPPKKDGSKETFETRLAKRLSPPQPFSWLDRKPLGDA